MHEGVNTTAGEGHFDSGGVFSHDPLFCEPESESMRGGGFLSMPMAA
ncbi:MAG: hypothetical protein CM1200mP20_13940 [Pseudomonadota bacterium]|nr:MAG: hypothetical protein CM1200mP20_13940 [Pseudomonadota bacterium]